jgi:NADH:ubiquinone oxidoreductase subunit 6 (subunit J)
MNAALIFVAAATVGSAAAAMLGGNLLRSIFMLAVSWAGVAAFYMWAGAQFVAFAQVLIYLGAISMVALFAVLLTRHSREDPPPFGAALRRGLLAVLVAAGVAAVLISAVVRSPLAVATSLPPTTSVRQLGGELMGQHAAALLVVGVLLTIALLGAVVLAANGAQERPGDKP